MRALAIVVILLVLPFLVFAWMAPFLDALTISHDYVVYAIGNQLELQLAIASGEWPLFVPGFAAGAPAPALMLGQLYHPISHLAAALPGYWNGLALEWNSALRLISLGLTHLALFAFLRRLAITPAIAFGISAVTVYNLRMLDLFRYGASLEGYTATLLLCTALAWHFAEPTRRLGPVAIALSTALLLVSGHPQITYYGLLSAAIIWGLTPSLVRAVAPGMGSGPWRYRLTSAGAVLTGIVLAAIFWLPLYDEFISETAGRFEQTYQWSTNLQMNWLDLARALALPLAADVHGAFAGSLLAVVALLSPVLGGRTTPPVIWGLFAAVLGVLLFSLGDQTPIHRFFWELLPGQSSMRIPGRATQLLPVLFFWILAWRFRPHQPSARFFGRDLHGSVPAVFISGITVVLFALLLWREKAAPFAPMSIREIPDIMPMILLVCGIVMAISLATRYLRKATAAVSEPVFLIALLVQITIAMGYGTWVGPKPDIPTLSDLQAIKERSLDYPGAFGYGMYSAAAMEQLERTFLQPEFARLYARVEDVASKEAAWNRIAERRDPETALIEGAGLAFNSEGSLPFSGRVSLVHAGFNRNVFETFSNRPSAFVISFGHTPRWRAAVDGNPVSTYRANGYETAIMLPEGQHTVEVSYSSPATRTGAWSSTVGLVALALWLLLNPGPGRTRVMSFAAFSVLLMVIAALVVPAPGEGKGLGTRFEWHYPGPSRLEDQAFGRPTRSSEVLLPENVHRVHSSQAVDGSAGTAFVSAPATDPWWEVELKGDLPVERIVLLRLTEAEFAKDFRVILSGAQGEERVIAAQASGRRAEIRVSPPMSAHSLRILAPGHTTLALSSVQVFGENIGGRR